MPADSQPLIDTLSPSKRQALYSLFRYFEWADDMRRLYLHLLSESPIGQKRAEGVTAEEAFELAKADPVFGRSVITTLYAFPYLSYFYAGMFVVIEAWTKRLKYHDPEIDQLLRSPSPPWNSTGTRAFTTLLNTSIRVCERS